MPRYKLTIEYNGMPYYGWQRQADVISVQQALEEAIQQFAQHKVTTIAAGRTDAGVHALGQVVHVDLQKTWTTDKIVEAANGLLRFNEHPIAVTSVEQVDDEFDARFSAIQRHYRYRLINRKAPLTVENERAWWIRFPLDVEAMHEAAQELVGQYDFTTFRDTECQAKSPIRTIDKFSVYLAEGNAAIGGAGRTINFDISARAFLHSQVRSMVGSLKMVGDGKWSKQDLIDARDAKDRKACGVVAPPYGLYLVQVDYP
ncbi:MAG: tRNA pseudouridine(38-40) synthase TruA [Rhizobiaceae bacterium]